MQYRASNISDNMMPLVLPDEKIRREICKSLGEDTARTEKQVEAFKEWLKCEPHLPKDVGKIIFSLNFCLFANVFGIFRFH